MSHIIFIFFTQYTSLHTRHTLLLLKVSLATVFPQKISKLRHQLQVTIILDITFWMKLFFFLTIIFYLVASIFLLTGMYLFLLLQTSRSKLDTSALSLILFSNRFPRSILVTFITIVRSTPGCFF